MRLSVWSLELPIHQVCYILLEDHSAKAAGGDSRITMGFGPKRNVHYPSRHRLFHKAVYLL